MTKELKVEKTKQCTIYVVGVSDKYRIVQRKDKEFVIEKLFKTTRTQGYLWWQKKTSFEEWKRVSVKGQKRYTSRGGLYSNYNDFKEYKTFKKALKWIEDYNKYPIYH